jgi:hypothetical protein
MKKTLIDVTEAHISRGQPGQPCFCVLAIAIGEKLRAGLQAVIGFEFTDARYTFQIRNTHGIYLTELQPLPHEASLLAERFDDGFEVSPIGFTVELPEEVLR